MNPAAISLTGYRRLFISILFTFLLVSLNSKAQEFEVPAGLPSTKEEFVNTEKNMIAAAKWLETTAIGSDVNKRTKVNAWVIGWVVNSPTVTINLRASVIKLFDKNPQLNAVYLAGYAKYCLENNYSKDELQANIAGIKAVINCYNIGGDVKKDKSLTKVIEKQKQGKLEDWVKDAMDSK